MSKYEYGPLRSYEITWMSGHIETIQAHQVSWPSMAVNLFRQLASGDDSDPFIRFHGEVDGRWTLVLQAREREIRTVRDVTAAERVPGGEVSA